MERCENLLNKIAEAFNIVRGDQENECDWVFRIVYSLAARMGYASLWDLIEENEDTDEQSVSIEHFKERIKEILYAYASIYKQLRVKINRDRIDMLSEDIYDTYLKTGNLYHQSYRVLASCPVSAATERITFCRGYPLEINQSVSGAGTYLLSENGQQEEPKAISLQEMFQLSEVSLPTYARQLVKSQQWKSGNISVLGMEYLSVPGKMDREYWRSEPDASLRVSLLRIGYGGDRVYYIYRRGAEGLQYNELPGWQVVDGKYLQLANALLAFQGMLPPASYRKDGNRIIVHIHYLYPPAEQKFFELYSWPLTLDKKGKYFYRVFQRDVFIAIKDMFEQLGYQFVEAGSNEV